MHFFDREFCSTFEAMTETLDEAVHVLRDQGVIGPSDEASTRLCLEEALVNAVRHGNQLDATRRVRLDMAVEGEDCVIRVRDEGTGFCPDDIRLPRAEQLGGRGICLIRHFMDHVEFCEDEGCLKMRFRRKALA